MTGATSPFDDLTAQTLRSRGTLKWSAHGPEVLAAWVAEMDFPTSEAVRRAVADAVEREEFGYPAPPEHTGLPQTLARFCADRYGWAIEPDRVQVVPDVLRGVELAVDRFSPAEAAVILPTPAYMPFFDVPPLVHRPTVMVPTLIDRDGVRRLDLQRIDDAFAAGAGTLILCHPYNPLGRAFTAAELGEVAEVVDRRGGRVVSDEIHAPLTYGGRRHVPYASVSDIAASHSITLVSASKGWNLPGLRCAQVVLHNEADAARWATIPGLRSQGASTLGITANVAAYRYGSPWLEDLIAYLDGNRILLAELLADHLPGAGYRPPEATYLAWIDCSALGVGDDPAAFFLAEAGVALSPGPAFGPDGAGHVRLNFATSKAILSRIVESMGTAIRRRGRPRG